MKELIQTRIETLEDELNEVAFEFLCDNEEMKGVLRVVKLRINSELEFLKKLKSISNNL